MLLKWNYTFSTMLVKLTPHYRHCRFNIYNFIPRVSAIHHDSGQSRKVCESNNSKTFSRNALNFPVQIFLAIFQFAPTKAIVGSFVSA